MAEQVTNRAFLRFFLPWRVDVIGFVHRCRSWCSQGPRMSHGEARHRTAAFPVPRRDPGVHSSVDWPKAAQFTILKRTILPQVRLAVIYYGLTMYQALCSETYR